MPNENDSPSTEKEFVGAVTVKLPAFMESASIGWFTIAEAQFKLRHIVESATKFYHVLSFLPPEVVMKIRPDTLQSNSYENLKQEVVDLYEKSKPELFEKLISKTVLTGRPSLFLNELITLGSKVGVNEDLVRHRFLQTVPPTISPVLMAQKDLNINQLGKLADELVVLTEKNAVVNEVKPSLTYSKPSPRSRSTSPAASIIPIGLKPFHAAQKPQICRAHIYFSDKARTCKNWCRYPNKSSNLNILPNSRSASPARSSGSGN